MSIYVYELDNLIEFKKPIFMIGSFESFHIGHNELLLKAKELNALSNNERDIVLIYFADVENLPKNNGIKFTDELYRLENFAKLGFTKVLRLKYDTIKLLSPFDFINKITQNQHDFDIISGSDFRYGVNASGDVNTLKDFFGEKFHCIDLMKLANEQKVSTSFIKECLLVGDIEVVNLLCLFKYGFNTKVTLKNDRIHLDNVPNLAKIRPGLYCANIIVNSMAYYCILCVFNDNSMSIEMIDFDWKSYETFEAKILIHKLIRPFFSNAIESTTSQDFEQAKEFFIEQIN
ncbi:hypothetical protein E1I18_01470 [Mycoplasmopsis mucosicanis]|uniref:FAD synthase n=1 Tax=Mycoplasmopsis mucosicanis TaxID=458208 RepID=A0A507SUW3_9BACT|nr:hypothetical protein [Mycoplasmopsis mucosicanis]TQC53974.1 hypothetical protein E1I18_01470 [Mycoplasmopsis mucosicanis]